MSASKFSDPTKRKLSFTVYGKPVQKGSKKGFVVGKRAIIADDNSEKLRQWYGAVTSAAAQAMGDRPLFTGPIRLSILFCFHRPKGHYGTGRNAGVLKDSSPRHHIKKPDLDKLVRTIQDALSSTVYKDDSQVCMYGQLGKVYTESQERAEVTVEEKP
jgi:Holliday junction resolvase RusA-like endonuclease